MPVDHVSRSFEIDLKRNSVSLLPFASPCFPNFFIVSYLTHAWFRLQSHLNRPIMAFNLPFSESLHILIKILQGFLL
jgi:hypothetical protein